ncbi:MAG TPA: PEGA domain-containing protein, partial [Kofleriaceae bacterium]|nr:PEGA domain-containing protein [Kofleriaceae bacterium]
MRWARGVACAVVTSLALVVGAPLAHAGKEYAVRIATTPEGASVRIDDPDSDAVGETPWDGALEAGPYMVIISLPGHRQLIEEITVGKQKKRQSFSFTLEAIPESTIAVASDPNDDSADGATIMLDGVEAGTVPATFEATEGPHQIEVIKEGFERWEKWVEVTGGEKTTVEVLLLLPTGEAVTGAPRISTPRGPRVAPLVVATAGIEVGWRRWDYLEPRTGTARPFDANVVPLMRADIAGYPLAGSPTAAMRTLGLRLGLGLGFPPAADAGGGQSITSSWSELELGALYRHDTASGAWLRGDLAYSMMVFSFDE